MIEDSMDAFPKRFSFSGRELKGLAINEELMDIVAAAIWPDRVAFFLEHSPGGTASESFPDYSVLLVPDRGEARLLTNYPIHKRLEGMAVQGAEVALDFGLVDYKKTVVTFDGENLKFQPTVGTVGSRP